MISAKTDHTIWVIYFNHCLHLQLSFIFLAMLSHSHPPASLWMNHLYTLITESLSPEPTHRHQPTSCKLHYQISAISLLATPSPLHGCFKQDWWWPIKVLDLSCLNDLGNLGVLKVKQKARMGAEASNSTSPKNCISALKLWRVIQ